MEGPWIQTHSGRRFFFMEPSIDQISIDDIAHSLGQKVRFNGHTRVPYTVAEHCVRVSWICEIHGTARWGLMHDAAEAYLPDLASPLKHGSALGAHFKQLEQSIMKVICRRFHLRTREPDSVKWADLEMRATEMRDLLPPMTPRDAMEQMPEDGAQPLKTRIVPWSMREAEDRFLARYKELFGSI